MTDCNNFDEVQRCFITGRDDASCIEKTADCTLYFPSYMWSVYDKSNYNVHGYGFIYAKDICSQHGPCFCATITFPLYLALSILALPLLIIGGPVKSCILCCDKKAAAYNKEIEFKIKNRPNEFAPVIVPESLNNISQAIKEKKYNLNIMNERIADFSHKANQIDHVTFSAPDDIQNEMSQLISNHKKEYEYKQEKISSDIQKITTAISDLSHQKAQIKMMLSEQII